MKYIAPIFVLLISISSALGAQTDWIGTWEMSASEGGSHPHTWDMCMKLWKDGNEIGGRFGADTCSNIGNTGGDYRVRSATDKGGVLSGSWDGPGTGTITLTMTGRNAFKGTLHYDGESRVTVLVGTRA